MPSLRHALATLALAITATACSSASSGGAPPAIVASADGGASDASSEAASGTLVFVQYASKSAVVDVASLPRQDYKGSSVVALSKVWDAAALGVDRAKLQFDFEGDDGFHPSSKPRCATPITGAQLAQGYVLPDTRTLVWDDALGLPGCYAVKFLAKVIASDAP